MSTRDFPFMDLGVIATGTGTLIVEWTDNNFDGTPDTFARGLKSSFVGTTTGTVDGTLHRGDGIGASLPFAKDVLLIDHDTFGSPSGNFVVNAVPEPGTFALLGVGIVGAIAVVRRRLFRVRGEARAGPYRPPLHCDHASLLDRPAPGTVGAGGRA